MNVSKDLPALRRDIDEIDAAIVDLLAKRMQVCREVATIKAGSATPVIQPARVREVLTSRRQWAIDHGVDAVRARRVDARDRLLRQARRGRDRGRVQAGRRRQAGRVLLRGRPRGGVPEPFDGKRDGMRARSGVP